MKEGLRSINRQITELAPILNSPTLSGYASVRSENSEVPIDMLVKNSGKTKYIFSVAMKEGQTRSTFEVKSGKHVEVLGENRTLTIKKGKFTDEFSANAVHLYKIN
jgi:hypothetical protein